MTSGGCVSATYTRETPEGLKVTTSVTSVLNNTVLKGLELDKETKATHQGIKVGTYDREVNTEAISAVAEGVAKGLMKGVNPVP